MPVLSNASQTPVLVETTPAPSALPVERIFAEQRASQFLRESLHCGPRWAPIALRDRHHFVD